MKIIFDGYEVEIRAKLEEKTRYTKKDTMDVLNTLSIYMREAAHNLEKEGYNRLAKRAENEAENIYNILKENGLYNK